MKFSITKRTKAPDTFKISALMGKYDLANTQVVEKFEGEIPIETIGEWNIGVIVGNSGTGKTTIAKKLFGDEYISSFEYTAGSIIEDMPKTKTVDDISKAFISVGFASVKSWLKPYHVLSNGEKMRVDLARSILENRDLVVFDEFTSVVDRTVAKVGSTALQKAVRKHGKKFIAVTCHYDILEWLEPDWIFDANTMQFTFTRGELRRPKIQFDIYEAKGFWPVFGKHHYLNHSLASSSRQFVAFIDDQPVAFCAIMPFVHNTVKGAWRMHRLVVLPDYQGIGIGPRLFDFVAETFKKEGKRVLARFSHAALNASLQRNLKWVCNAFMNRVPMNSNMRSLNNAGSQRRRGSSWEYLGTKGETK